MVVSFHLICSSKPASYLRQREGRDPQVQSPEVRLNIPFPVERDREGLLSVGKEEAELTT